MDEFENTFLKEALEFFFAGLEKLSREAVFYLNNLAQKYVGSRRKEDLVKFCYSIARKVLCFLRNGLLEEKSRVVIWINSGRAAGGGSELATLAGPYKSLVWLLTYSNVRRVLGGRGRGIVLSLGID